MKDQFENVNIDDILSVFKRNKLYQKFRYEPESNPLTRSRQCWQYRQNSTTKIVNIDVQYMLFPNL